MLAGYRLAGSMANSAKVLAESSYRDRTIAERANGADALKELFPNYGTIATLRQPDKLCIDNVLYNRDQECEYHRIAPCLR